MWPGLRRTCVPSFILIRLTVWPQCTNVADRQDRTDRTGQRNDIRENRFTNGRPRTSDITFWFFSCAIRKLNGESLIRDVRLSVRRSTGQDVLTNRWTTSFINQNYVAIEYQLRLHSTLWFMRHFNDFWQCDNLQAYILVTKHKKFYRKTLKLQIAHRWVLMHSNSHKWHLDLPRFLTVNIVVYLTLS